MSVSKDPFSMYMERLKAERASGSLNEYKEHLIWARRCRELLNELRQVGFDFAEEIQISVDVARSVSVSTIIRPDFMVTRDTIRLPIFLDVESEIGDIPTGRFRQYQRALRNDPTLSAVVSCWRSDDIPSVALDAARLLKFELPQGQVVHLNDVAPLRTTITTFYERSFVGEWDIARLAATKVIKSTSNAFESLEPLVYEQFNIFSKRILRKPDHVEAQRLIDFRALEQLLSIFKESLRQGDSIDAATAVLQVIAKRQQP